MSLFGRYYFVGRHSAAFDYEDGAAALRELGSFSEVWRPPADVVEFADGWMVRMELGGIDADDVQVRVGADRLTVNGVRRPWCPGRASGNASCYRQMEIRHGLFRRSFDLPGVVRAEAVHAVLRGGFLEITLPRAEASEPSLGDWLVVSLSRQ